MKTNRLEINITELSDGKGKCKKEWIKPEVEVISKDLIKIGSISSSPEGQRTGISGHIGAGVS